MTLIENEYWFNIYEKNYSLWVGVYIRRPKKRLHKEFVLIRRCVYDSQDELTPEQTARFLLDDYLKSNARNIADKKLLEEYGDPRPVQ